MLKTVTVTGADDSVKPSDLAEIAAEYPFVEFGILFRGTQDREKSPVPNRPRFPSFDWVLDLLSGYGSKYHLALSCHLCGQAVHDFLEGVFLGAPQPLNIHFRRAQINTHGIVHAFDARRLRETVHRMTLNNQQVIFQHDGVNSDIMLSCVGRYVHKGIGSTIGSVIATTGTIIPAAVGVDIDDHDGFDIAALYDLSHGGGVLPEKWDHPLAKTAIPCGFAGGLSPENVASQIAKIQDVMGEADFWIDAETHLRSADDRQFDLAKVRRFLEAAKPYCRR
jgi:tRNA-splicing ligase RtcB